VAHWRRWKAVARDADRRSVAPAPLCDRHAGRTLWRGKALAGGRAGRTDRIAAVFSARAIAVVDARSRRAVHARSGVPQRLRCVPTWKPVAREIGQSSVARAPRGNRNAYRTRPEAVRWHCKALAGGRAGRFLGVAAEAARAIAVVDAGPHPGVCARPAGSARCRSRSASGARTACCTGASRCRRPADAGCRSRCAAARARTGCSRRAAARRPRARLIASGVALAKQSCGGAAGCCRSGKERQKGKDSDGSHARLERRATGNGSL
jgi:hypothetical protein